MQVSPRFLSLIEQFEGFRAQAYRDAGGVWTIGYGHVITASETELQGETLTRDQAEAILLRDVQHAADIVNAYVTVPIRQEQFDALVDFVFNVGAGAFERSTLLRELNAGKCCAVPDQLRKWNRVNGHVVDGLTARREAEVSLFIGAA